MPVKWTEPDEYITREERIAALQKEEAAAIQYMRGASSKAKERFGFRLAQIRIELESLDVEPKKVPDGVLSQESLLQAYQRIMGDTLKTPSGSFFSNPGADK